MKKSVMQLDHITDAEGVHPTTEKLEAIVHAPAPQNTSELRSYLGMLNYYKFLENVSSLLAALHLLVQKDVVWQWGNSQQHVFKKSKRLLQSSKLLLPQSTVIVKGSNAYFGLTWKVAPKFFSQCFHVIQVLYSMKLHDGILPPLSIFIYM